ncbi:MAG: hypothetical protein D6728_16095 [Cyanobacteria bacterium J055]|nr:MAG: hypothetical protein D6728_16095 [Cyanobacteria bacterium J055]
MYESILFRSLYGLTIQTTTQVALTGFILPLGSISIDVWLVVRGSWLVAHYRLPITHYPPNRLFFILNTSPQIPIDFPDSGTSPAPSAACLQIPIRQPNVRFSFSQLLRLDASMVI